MDFVALWVGYAVMAAGGVIFMLGIAWIAGECCYRMAKHGMNMGDLLEALTEWKEAHPEKFKRWKVRND